MFLVFFLIRANKAKEQPYNLNYASLKSLKLNFKQIKLILMFFSFFLNFFFAFFFVIFLQIFLSSIVFFFKLPKKLSLAEKIESEREWETK